MSSKPVSKDPWQSLRERVEARLIRLLPVRKALRAVQSPHFWVITFLMVFLTALYYEEQLHLAGLMPFCLGFCTTVHDLHRALFLIPTIYAAVVFRMRGGLIVSFAFLCVILPRALIFSPYPHPLVRAIVFFIPATLFSLLISALLDQIETTEKARAQLDTAHHKLAESLNRLEESQEQLIQAEKLTSLGQMAASIAHEVNNPLSGVLVYIQLLQKKMTNDSLSKPVALNYLSKMASEIDRSSRIIRNLLSFARPSAPRLGAVDVNQVIEQALSLVGHQAELERVEVIKEGDPSLPDVWADFDQLRQVFVNLTLNAIQAMPNGGTLTLRTLLDKEGSVRVDVEDTGSGISRENMQKLFTPFFTTKGKGQGVGLGLAVTQGIIEKHGGRIEVKSEEGKGTTFSVYLLTRESKTDLPTSQVQ